MGLILLITAVGIMAKAADLEGRSSFAWGAITLIMCIISGIIIPIPLVNILIGVVATFLIMFAAKIIQKEN